MMTINPRLADKPGTAVGLAHRQQARTHPGTGRNTRPMRRYRISHLTGDGRIDDCERVGPAIPLFEAAFSAFARGTLVATLDGPVAIEDLSPGMRVQTGRHGPCPVLWIGSMTLVPDAMDLSEDSRRMTRIMADALGMGRPLADFMVGPGARLLTRPAGLRGKSSGEQVLTPARHVADGVQIIDILPPRPLALYHLCLRDHDTILAQGLEAETYHPGPDPDRTLGPALMEQFMGLFPHLRKPADFGPLAFARLPLGAGERQGAA